MEYAKKKNANRDLNINEGVTLKLTAEKQVLKM